MRRIAAVMLGVLLVGGCYHATVNTGIETGPRRVEQKWAKSFVYGLVPPDAVDAQSECGDSGVARVETKLSFLNQFVGALTLGIFTPMEIVVTCGRDTGEDGEVPQESGSAADELPEPGDGSPPNH